jgi:hypothetical protein
MPLHTTRSATNVSKLFGTLITLLFSFSLAFIPTPLAALSVIRQILTTPTLFPFTLRSTVLATRAGGSPFGLVLSTSAKGCTESIVLEGQQGCPKFLFILVEPWNYESSNLVSSIRQASGSSFRSRKFPDGNGIPCVTTSSPLDFHVF